MIINRNTAPIGTTGFAAYDGYVIKVTKDKNGDWNDNLGTGLIDGVIIFDNDKEARGKKKKNKNAK